MGYVEQQPLPMLEGLELRRVPETGQEILVAGAEDPLIYDSEQVAVLGWIEAYPILPRAGDMLHTGPWAVVSLRRQVDRRTWRHRYRGRPAGRGADGVELGSLLRHPGPGAVALRLRSDGRLASELCSRAAPAATRARSAAGWPSRCALPARKNSGAARPAAPAPPRASTFGSRRLAEDEGEVLGYLLRQRCPAAAPSTARSTRSPATSSSPAPRRRRPPPATSWTASSARSSIRPTTLRREAVR